MRIEPFDPRTADPATVRAWAAAGVEWSEVWAPKGLPPSAAWLVNEATHPSADQVRHWWVAYDGDRLVGGVVMEWFDAPDNRDRAFLHVEVPPALVTPALLDGLVGAVAAVAVPAGRTVLNVYSPAESPLSAWLRARGGTLGSVEEVNVARFDRLDRDDLAALAAATPPGYELVAYDGGVPDDLMAPFLVLVDAMNDAPRDDLTMEDWVFTPERIRAYDAALAARGHTMWTVAARHVETGALAGFNQLLVYPDWPEVIENEDTGVSEAHRGHGLGLWLKSVNLLRALDHPGARCVLTWNAASNEHMLRVNRRLGFACEHTWESWELPAPTVA